MVRAVAGVEDTRRGVMVLMRVHERGVIVRLVFMPNYEGHRNNESCTSEAGCNACLFYCFQGLAVAVFYCFINEEVSCYLHSHRRLRARTYIRAPAYTHITSHVTTEIKMFVWMCVGPV